METLASQLAAQKERSRANLGEERFAAIATAVDELRAAGAARSAPRVGERAPDFSLPNLHGDEIRLGDVLGRRACVLAFYRGAW
jgi:hypothetical protein